MNQENEMNTDEKPILFDNDGNEVDSLDDCYYACDEGDDCCCHSYKKMEDIYNKNELRLIEQLHELNELQGDYKLIYCVHENNKFIDVEAVHKKEISFYAIENIVRTLKGEFDWKGIGFRVLSASATNIKDDRTRCLYRGEESEHFYRKFRNGFYRNVKIKI